MAEKKKKAKPTVRARDLVPGQAGARMIGNVTNALAGAVPKKKKKKK